MSKNEESAYREVAQEISFVSSASLQLQQLRGFPAHHQPGQHDWLWWRGCVTTHQPRARPCCLGATDRSHPGTRHLLRWRTERESKKLAKKVAETQPAAIRSARLLPVAVSRSLTRTSVPATKRRGRGQQFASSGRGPALRPVNHRRPSSSASRSPSAPSFSASRSPLASSSSASRARATSTEPAPTWTLAQEPIQVP